MSDTMYKKYLPAAVSLLQFTGLFLLRQIWLRTVFQTAATYLLLCSAGIVLMVLSQKSGKNIWRQLWDCYLIFWSGIHAVIVLGFMTCGTFYLTWTQVTFVQIVNLFLGCTLYWILYLLFRRPDRAAGAGNLLIGVLGTANFYLVKFRGAPFRLEDIRSARTAGNVVKSYDFKPSVLFVIMILDLVVWYWIWRKYYQCLKKESNDEGECKSKDKPEYLNGIKNKSKRPIRTTRITRPTKTTGPTKTTTTTEPTTTTTTTGPTGPTEPTKTEIKTGSLPKRRKQKWLNPVSLCATIVIAAGCIALPVIQYDKIYANTFQFSNDTCLAGLLAEMMGSRDTLPDQYSIPQVRQIMDGFQMWQSEDSGQEESPSAVKPNIVVIMNEAFSDLRVLGDFETNVPMLEFWDSLEENTLRGRANVSVLGGNTANSEYEFLTSDTSGAFSNRIPYSSYFDGQDAYPGLVSVLKDQGYRTAAFHPYLSSGWNRIQVYRSMQFDETIFLDDVETEPDTLRLYVSDRGNYAFIRDWFEKKEPGVPQFFFNVTMQNHGGYTYEGENFETTVWLAGDAKGRFPETEQFMSLIKASDEAFRELLAYFAEYPEPVVVVMFGDHQPKLEDEFYTYITGRPVSGWSLEERMNMYKTPFVIWRNYPAESKDLGDVSLNYLAAILLEDTGLKMSPYQNYTLAQYKEMPVVTSLGMADREGTVRARGSSEFEAFISDYKLLIYNHTVDIENRIPGFFSR